MKINKNSKIFIAGHNGMVGSSIKRKFEENGFKNIITVNKNKLNLIDQKKVFIFLEKKKPDLVILAAAKVGGIVANSLNKSQFIYDNIQIQNNVIHGSYLAKKYGWKSKTSLKEGLLKTLEDFKLGYRT